MSFRQDVDAMAEELAGAGGVLAPSQFWAQFAAANRDTLEAEGLDRFKRSVNHNYFQFVVAHPRRPEFRAVLRQWSRRPTTAPLRARMVDTDVSWFHDDRPDAVSPRWRPRVYALYVALLWELARRRAGAEIADRLDEPEVGRPMLVRHRGRGISQDLANSLLEYATIAEALGPRALDGQLVVEIGGGYGRVAALLATVVPDVRIVMVDIPPALALAQHYLTSVLPDRRVARFRQGAAPGELSAAIAGADLAFVTPNQFESLPDLGARLVVNISSFHELRPEQVAAYFELIARHANGGWLYTKQWERWHNPVDDVVMSRDAYPYPESWARVLERTHPAQVAFFEAVYAVR